MVELVKDLTTLTTKSEKFDFQNPQIPPSELAHKLLEAMNEHDGLGLSAIQIGIPVRVFVMRTVPEAFVCFNPTVAMPSTETIRLEEGCLSFPGLWVKVRRPQHVRCRFAGPDGEVRTHLFTGMTARTFYHEMDHLDGKLFFEGVNRFYLAAGIKKAEKRGFHYTGLMKYAKTPV